MKERYPRFFCRLFEHFFSGYGIQTVDDQIHISQELGESMRIGRQRIGFNIEV